jgi:tetratricopeptide (TPR) repeat protein
VRAPVKRAVPALLLVPAAAWLLGAQGVDLAWWAGVTTVLTAVGLLLSQHRTPTVVWRAPGVWLAGLTAWAAAAAVLRPVAPAQAAYLVAVGAVSCLLGLVAGRMSARAWAALAVSALGAATGAWLVIERLLIGLRPGGPFGSPNLSATVALLGLCVTPKVRLKVPWRLSLAVLAGGGVLASGSRAAQIGIVLAALAHLLGTVGHRVMRLAAVMCIVAAAAGLAWRFGSDRDPLRYERFRLWLVAARTAQAELPWGAGPGGYADAALPWNFPRDGELARFGRVPSLAESDALEVAATLGLPGLLLAGGVLASVLLCVRRAGPTAWGLVAALGCTSALSSQLMVPVVAWSATLALAAVLPAGRGRRARLEWSAAAPAAVLLGGVLCIALGRPAWWLGGPPENLLQKGEALLGARSLDDAALADAEAQVWQAAALQSRHSTHWRLLGDLRLARARVRHEAGLVAAALAAFRQAEVVNPNDAWSALGEARALRLLGDGAAARAAIIRTLQLEPNLLQARVEQGVLLLESGDLDAARRAMADARVAIGRARSARPGSEYERALMAVDSGMLARLQAATGSP